MTDHDKALVERLEQIVFITEGEEISDAISRIEAPPAGYRKLPEGTRCRCIRLWQDGVGGFYCCRSSATLAFGDSLSQHCPNCEAQAAEIEKLREALKEVFEAWAGSEGFIPETAPEGYLLYLTKRMAHIARAALGETK